MHEDPPPIPVVRPCTDADLPALERDLPNPEPGVHARHLDRQRDGVRTYLGAFQAARVLGTCVVGWEGCREPGMRAALPGAVEIAALHVAEEARGQGTGTRLVRAAEQLADARGLREVVICVGDDNTRATALYARLGYEDSGVREVLRYEFTAPDGSRVDVVEPARALVRRLPTP